MQEIEIREIERPGAWILCTGVSVGIGVSRLQYACSVFEPLSAFRWPLLFVGGSIGRRRLTCLVVTCREAGRYGCFGKCSDRRQKGRAGDDLLHNAGSHPQLLYKVVRTHPLPLPDSQTDISGFHGIIQPLLPISHEPLALSITSTPPSLYSAFPHCGALIIMPIRQPAIIPVTGNVMIQPK